MVASLPSGVGGALLQACAAVRSDPTRPTTRHWWGIVIVCLDACAHDHNRTVPPGEPIGKIKNVVLNRIGH